MVSFWCGFTAFDVRVWKSWQRSVLAVQRYCGTTTLWRIEARLRNKYIVSWIFSQATVVQDLSVTWRSHVNKEELHLFKHMYWSARIISTPNRRFAPKPSGNARYSPVFSSKVFGVPCWLIIITSGPTIICTKGRISAPAIMEWVLHWHCNFVVLRQQPEKWFHQGKRWDSIWIRAEGVGERCTQLRSHGSGARTFWLVGHICLSETLCGPQELIISTKIILNDWSVKFSFQWKLLRGPLQRALRATCGPRAKVWAPLSYGLILGCERIFFHR